MFGTLQGCLGKNVNSTGRQRSGLSTEELGAMFPNPRFAWWELPLSHWRCWIMCRHGNVSLVSGKVSYSGPEETHLDESVFRNVPGKNFSLHESAFYLNKLSLKIS